MNIQHIKIGTMPLTQCLEEMYGFIFLSVVTHSVTLASHV